MAMAQGRASRKVPRPRRAFGLAFIAFTALVAASACHASGEHLEAGRDSSVDAPSTAASTSTPDAEMVIADGAALSQDGGSDAIGDGGPKLGALCFPPLPNGIDPCPKGAMAGDTGLERCRREHSETKRAASFKVATRSSSSFSPSLWRCVSVPLDQKEHVSLGSIGVDVTVPATCDSHTMDMQGPNFYGAVFFRCSTRRRSHDELLPAN